MFHMLCCCLHLLLLQYCKELLKICLSLQQVINLCLCHALGLLCLSIALKSTSDRFTEALEQALQEFLVFTSSCMWTGCHGGDEISLFALRLKSNNKPAIVVILAEAKMTINLKIPTEEVWELFLAFQQVKYNVSDKISNQLFRNRFNKLLVVLIDATLIL